MNRPTTIQSQPQAARFEAQFTGPRRHVLCLAAMREHVGILFSLTLLKGRLPSAVARGVSELPVFSSNGMIRRWLRPHVPEELSQALRSTPSIAHGYAAGAVFFVAIIALAVASALHGLPASKSFGPDKFSVLVHNPIRVSARDAAARFNVTISEVNGVHLDERSAVTAATPSSLGGRSFGAANHREAMVLFSSQVEHGGHDMFWVKNHQNSHPLYHVNT